MIRFRKRTVKIVLLLTPILFLMFAVSGETGEQKLAVGIRKIKNSSRPLKGNLRLELKEDLRIGDIRNENEAFFYKIGIAVDGQGDIYVVDKAKARIQKFSARGRFLRSIGKKGQGPGEFENPMTMSIMVDKKNDLFVLDQGKIHHFDSQGNFQGRCPVSLNCSGIFPTLSEDFFCRDMLFFEKSILECIHLWSRSGKALKKVIEFPSVKAEASLFGRFRFVAVAPELLMDAVAGKSMVFGYSSEYRIYKTDPEGNIILIIENDEPAEKIPDREREAVIERIGKKDRTGDICKRIFFSACRPFFDQLLADGSGAIFVRRVKSALDRAKGDTFDFYDARGRFVYRVETVGNVLRIDGGSLYAWEYLPDDDCVVLKRYSIQNFALLNCETGAGS